jgi:hypothetical protein
MMRTTLTIEPAVAERLRHLLKEEDRTLKSLVNDALREGLKVLENERKSRRAKFRVEPHNFGALRPGIDPARIGQYAEELEDEAAILRYRRQ